MIAFVKGVLETVTEQGVIVDNNGLGYFVSVPASTLSRLPARGQPIKLHTYLQVKEDGLSLFGFLTEEELRIFTLLLSVSGIGPKAGMGILSTLTPAQVMVAIVTDDAAALSRAPGVGKKTAQRVLLELRDKIQGGDTSVGPGWASSETGGMATDDKQDAVDALLALGYSRSESVKAVLEIATEDMKTEQIIKQALKRLMR